MKNEGSVVLLVNVNTNGKARVKRVLRPLGNGLDEEAIKAVHHWRFRPALKRGMPVSMDTTVEVEFRLKQRPDAKASRLSDRLPCRAEL